MMRRSRVTQWLAVTLLAVGLLVTWIQRIDGRGVEKDAGQNVQMALNLAHHGVMSLDEEAPYEPSNYREPLPIFVSAAVVRLIDGRLGTAPDQAYFQGERVRLLKYQNLLWITLLCIGTFQAIRLMSSSFYLALLGVLAVALPFLPRDTALNDLYTEIPAAAAFMFASLGLASMIRKRTVGSALLAGVLFGALTLTKASGLYLFAGVLIVVATIYLWAGRTQPPRVAAVQLLVMLIAFGGAIAPWIYRNETRLGTSHISQRAGVVLMQRAVYDLMSPEERLGAVYVWADPRIQPLVGRVLGFSAQDLLRHGRLQRLNDWKSDFEDEDLAAELAGTPEKALTYYRQARAERVKADAAFSAAGHPRANIAADDAVRDNALAIIEQHPWNHFLLTVLLLWRGAALIFIVLTVVLWVSARRQEWDLVGFSIAAFGAAIFYALASEFLGRFAVPLRPIAVVALLVIAERTLAHRLARGIGAFRTRAPVSS
jgi:hypothetical protein